MTDKRVLVGIIAGAHGIKGEVRVKTFTADPAGIGAYGPLLTEDGKRLEIAALRSGKPGETIVRFAGAADRNEAERLKGKHLYVPRAALPPPAPGEYYHVDLIGLRAETTDGAVLGTVLAMHNFGAGDVAEIEFPDGHTEFVPFSDGNVPVVDVEGGRIVILLPPQED